MLILNVSCIECIDHTENVFATAIYNISNGF